MTDLKKSPAKELMTKPCNHRNIVPQTSHLTTLVRRFLTTLENIKHWNQIDNLVGETRLKHHVSNIIEYTYFLQQKQILEQEVETLIKILEGENRD